MISVATDSDRTLPKGWKWVRLGNVSKINPSRPQIDRGDDEPTTFVPMEAVDAQTGKITASRLRPYGEIKKGYTCFSERDVLFAKITPCMQNGKHAVAVGLEDDIGFGTTEFHVIRPGPDITPHWIHSLLRQPALLQKATEHFTGAVGQQRLPPDYLKSLEMPLPPLTEQKRIAAILNAQMTVLECARKAAEERLAAVNALPAAYLRTVFPGLGATLPKGWRWVQLGEIISETRNGLYKHASYYRRGTRILKMFNIGRFDGSWLCDRVDEVELTQAEHDTYMLREGDILLNRVNSLELVGKCAVVDSRMSGAVFESKNIRVRFVSEIAIPDFVAMWINSAGCRRQIDGMSRQIIGQATINNADLAAIVIPLPSILEQDRIVAMLCEQMATVTRVRAAAGEQLATTNALPAALLHKAFAGEL